MEVTLHAVEKSFALTTKASLSSSWGEAVWFHGLLPIWVKYHARETCNQLKGMSE
jgi:hypothetical protein